MPAAFPSRLSDYSRLRKTVFAPRQVASLHAVVAGAGALGNEVVKALGLLGFGAVTIVDPDVIEPSNLTRSLFFRQCPMGAGKAEALATAAQSLFSDTKFAFVAQEIADAGFERLRGADLMFSCVDSDLARLEMAHISTKLDLPVCDAGLGAHNYSHGRVTWFPGSGAACYGCKLSPRKRRELLTFWDATIRPCSAEPPPDAYPSTPTMAAITGALQVEIGLRRLFQKCAQSWTTEIATDGLQPRLAVFQTRISEGCPFHERPPETLLEAPDLQVAVQQVLAGQAPGSYLHLDWPLCVRAECRACGHGWMPALRSAVIRRRGACPACGSRDILEQETVRTIGLDSPWSAETLAALGVPSLHLLTVRSEDA